MIDPLNITGIKCTIDDRTEKYIKNKIGKLSRFLPRHARKIASAKVIVKQVDQKDGNIYEVEAIIDVPNKTIKSEENTSNVLAAIDIIERRLSAQLRKYKETTNLHEKNQGILAKFKRSFERGR